MKQSTEQAVFHLVAFATVLQGQPRSSGPKHGSHTLERLSVRPTSPPDSSAHIPGNTSRNEPAHYR
ncbi:MAG: hypothetical protein ACLFT5_07345, partial [Desulfovermiculus sp.]